MTEKYRLKSVLVAGVLIATTFLVLAFPGSIPTVFADAGSDQLVDMNETVDFDGSGTTGVGTIEFTWYFRDGTVITGTNPQPTHAFAAAGVYEVGMMAKDSNGYYDLDTVQITVRNYFPVADGGPDIVVNEDDTVNFDASASSDPNNDIISYEWEFGDGTSSVSGITAQNIYEKAGTYHVKLTVTDNDGAYDERIINITVNNVEPIPDGVANGEADDYLTIYEDDTVSFDGSQSTDTPSDMPLLMYAWDYGDGSKGQGLTATHTYTKSGTYTTTLTVADDNNASTQDTITINVLNAPPIADAGPDQTVYEGQSVFFDGSGSADTPSDEPLLDHSWSPGENGIYPTHAWFDDGINDAVIEVTDDDGIKNNDATTVAVLNSPPTVGVVAAYIPVDFRLRASGEKWHDVRFDIYEGSALHDYLEVTRYPGSPDDQAISKEIKVSVSEEATGAVFYTPLDDPNNGQPNGATPVWLTLTFEDGTEHTLFHSFNVQKPDEWTWEIDLSPFLAGKKIHFDGAVYEPGTDDVKIVWNFGDGSKISKNYPYGGTHPVKIIDSVEHTYASMGLFALELRAEDDDGGIGTDTLQVDSRSDGISVDNLAPSAYASADKSNAMEDEAVGFDGMGKDSSSDMNMLTYHWDFGDGNTDTASAPTHIYEKDGTYAAVLTVTDDSGDIGRDSVTINVENVEPQADLYADPSVIDEDEIVYFDATDSWDTPSDLPSLRYAWDYGDGSKADGKTGNHRYTKTGVYTVTLTVRDDNGAVSIETTTITVVNHAPFNLAISAKQTVKEDEFIFFTGSAQDTASDEPLLVYVWDFGDGTVGHGRNPTHTYPFPGVFTVRLAVNDDDSISTAEEIDILVNNVVPVAFAGATLLKVYGPEVTIDFDGRGFDTLSDQSTLSYEWNLGGGNFEYTPAIAVDFTSTGIYDISLEVADMHLSASTAISIRVDFTKDSDGDMLTDEDETSAGTNPYRWDTDGDDLMDSWEQPNNYPPDYPTDATLYDTDDDGLNDWEEVTLLGVIDHDGDGLVNPLDWDSDGDWIRDGDDPHPLKYDVGDLSVDYSNVASITVNNALNVSVIIVSPTCMAPAVITEITPSQNLAVGINPYINVYSPCPAGTFTAYIKMKYDQTELPSYETQYRLAMYKWYGGPGLNKWKILEDTGVEAANDIVWGSFNSDPDFGVGDSDEEDSDGDGLSDWYEKGTFFPATFKKQSLLADKPLDSDNDGSVADENIRISNSGGNWADISSYFTCSGLLCTASVDLFGLGFPPADFAAGYSWRLKNDTFTYVIVGNVVVNSPVSNIKNGRGESLYLSFISSDYYELRINAMGTLDPLNEDTDGDTLKDGEEVTKYRTRPLDYDTDDDGYWDNDDFNPLVDLQATVRVDEVHQFDAVDIFDDGDFYMMFNINGDWYTRGHYSGGPGWEGGSYPANSAYITYNFEVTKNIPDNVRYVDIIILLADDDYDCVGVPLPLDCGDDLVDINANDNAPIIDSILNERLDVKYGTISGNVSGDQAAGSGSIPRLHSTGNGTNSGDDDDCGIRFQIYANDADNDRVPYWKEVYSLNQDPLSSDSDGDGMEDHWENYYGLNANSASDKLADADGDGLQNYYEWLAGTAPNMVDSDNDGIWDDYEYWSPLLNPANGNDAGSFKDEIKEHAAKMKNGMEEASFWLSHQSLVNNAGQSITMNDLVNKYLYKRTDEVESLMQMAKGMGELAGVDIAIEMAEFSVIFLEYAIQVWEQAVVMWGFYDYQGYNSRGGIVQQIGYATNWNETLSQKLDQLRYHYYMMELDVVNYFEYFLIEASNALNVFGAVTPVAQVESISLELEDGTIVTKTLKDPNDPFKDTISDLEEMVVQFLKRLQPYWYDYTDLVPFVKPDVTAHDLANELTHLGYNLLLNLKLQRAFLQGIL